MTQTVLVVSLFVALLAMLPVGLKWAQRRFASSSTGAVAGSRVISAIAVGPSQKVVTVEVGPEGSRIWLTLGVTAQTITCLHATAVNSSQSTEEPPELCSTPGQ